MLKKYVIRDKTKGIKIDCFFEWSAYLKLALPGLAMVFFEWSNFEIGIILSGKIHKYELISFHFQCFIIDYDEKS